MEKVIKWKNKYQAYSDTLAYLTGRRKGEIKSFKTPYVKMDQSGVSGWEWGTIVTIGGRPGSFKSSLKDLIFNKSKEFNPQENFRILDIQLEMSQTVNVIREMCSAVQSSYTDLCSANAPLPMDILKKCYDHANKRVLDKSFVIDTVEESCTNSEFEALVLQYMEEHKDSTTGEHVKVLIGVDHTRLFDKEGSEDEGEMITNMYKVFVRLKRRFPYKIIFVVLSQLNRDTERPERNEDRKAGNYPTSSDYFGSDSVFQFSDICIILNRPALKNIKYYGPQAFVIDDGTILAAHYLKCRNAETYLTFMKADGATMSIYEIDPPQTAKNVRGNNLQDNHPDVVKVKEKNPLQPNNLFEQQRAVVEKPVTFKDIVVTTEEDDILPF